MQQVANNVDWLKLGNVSWQSGNAFFSANGESLYVFFLTNGKSVHLADSIDLNEVLLLTYHIAPFVTPAAKQKI